MNKKGFIDKMLAMVLGVVIVIAVMLFMIANLWPEVSEDVNELAPSYSENSTWVMESAWSLSYTNLLSSTVACVNYTGGTVTNTLPTNNYTVSASAGELTLTEVTWNNSNIQCSYKYHDSSSGNLSAIQTDTAVELYGLIGIIFVAITLMVILAIWRMYKGADM